MISMMHRDGDTTIQMVQVDDHFEVSLHQKGEPTIRVWEYDMLERAIAGYVLAVSAETAAYVGFDPPWYDAVREHAGPDKDHDRPA